MDDGPAIAARGDDLPYRAELELERERWTEIAELCRSAQPRRAHFGPATTATRTGA